MAQKKSSDYKTVHHGFGPFYNSDSEILVLGSFPSVKSREQKFYYGHPMNRFWKVLAAIFERPLPDTVDKKKEFLQDIHFALYDVIESCDIVGSSDVSIKNPVITDLFPIFYTAKIRLILINGTKAGSLFVKYQLPLIGDAIPFFVLPSTSPANAATSFERLCSVWKESIFSCARIKKD